MISSASAVMNLLPYVRSRVRNLLAKFCEILVYKVIASHSRKPKIRNMNQKFSKLAKGGPELSKKLKTNHTELCKIVPANL